MWIFGYGSLTWKVDFPYQCKCTGYIRGFQRRFYQHSVDHRGIPEKPGRVVTLLPANHDDQVWGIAYKIAEDNIEHVVNKLDYREKDGYKKYEVTFYPSDDKEPFPLILYIANEDNQCYAGPAEIKAIAEQIVDCAGPSGKNTEYLYNLAKTMREIAPNVADPHLYELEMEVKRIDQNCD